MKACPISLRREKPKDSSCNAWLDDTTKKDRRTSPPVFFASEAEKS